MKHFLKFFLAVSLSLSCTLSAFSQTDSIDIFIQHQMQKRRIPGLQLAIVRDGKIIKTGYYGIANIQDSIAVTKKQYLQSTPLLRHLWALLFYNLWKKEN